MSGPTGPERALLRLSAAVVAPAAALEAAVADAARDADPVAAEEVLLQSHLFAGYPAALGALAAWRRHRPAPALGSFHADDAAGTAGAAGEGAPGADAIRERGAQVCRVVYGSQYERLRANVARLHPELERWMLEDGYGKVLGRPGLSLRLRELCIVALAAGLDAPRQLYSHLRGALHAGASVEDVEAALAEAARVHETGRAAAAAEVWRDVRRRMEESAPGHSQED